METAVQVADLLGQAGYRALHHQARRDVADRQRPHRARRRPEFGEPGRELPRRAHVDDPAEPDPGVRGRAHRAVLPRGEDGGLGPLSGGHVRRGPAGQLDLRMESRVSSAVLAVAVLGQHPAVAGDEHRAEREIPGLDRLGRQFYAAAQVPQILRGEVSGAGARLAGVGQRGSVRDKCLLILRRPPSGRYPGGCDQLRTTADDAPRAGPLTRPDVPFPRPCYGASACFGARSPLLQEAAMHTYITTTIPYVNARPHIGFALELVQADVLARHRRGRGDRVRFQAGTDDNSLKNVLAAKTAGVDVREFVDGNARAFLALGPALSLTVDDVIRTSSDLRHRPGVERVWRACAAAGDLYRKRYEGLYCTGCEQFYSPADLRDGRCPEHETEPQRVAEENWFFRLSRYGEPLREAITRGELRIEPAGRRNEVLAFIAGGLEDFSVSRPAERAGGWGIPVPGDPGQVIYVWWDALCNYITALGYGTDGDAYREWWTGARRVHLLGKGVLRFHAVYWPAMLLSSGQPLPTDIYVHDYLTAGGRKISKSSGAAADPAELASEYGTDAVRWWLLREVPRVGDADFTVERMIAR